MRYVDMCPSRSNPNDEEYPCEVCGQYDDHCVCPECQVCGEVGCPKCYETSGCGQTMTEEQLASRAEVERQQEEDAERSDEWARQDMEDARLAKEYWDAEERNRSR